MANLRYRSQRQELMDGEDVTQSDFAACLMDLARVNTITLARPPTLAFIRRAMRATSADRQLTIVDVGYGAGDMLRAIARQCAHSGRTVRLIGYDINPRSKSVARGLTPDGMGIEFRTGDALTADEQIDLVISSLVTHHMTDAEILRFLRWMEDRAALGWFVNDLHRHQVAYFGFHFLSAIAGWHKFVRHDGPVSIARAFDAQDWGLLLGMAGVSEHANLAWKFPFRYCVERSKW